MIQKPNFKKAYILANEMLVASKSITTFPFDVEKVVSEETDLKFCSYKRALEKFGLNCFDLGSDSSVLTKLHGKNIVFYNQDECDVREPFNRLHETGHFLLNHKTDIKENDALYGIQEIETNYFASQMLLPFQILKEIERRGVKIDERFLMKHFGVSFSCAKHRAETLNKRIFLTNEEKIFDDIILMKFSKFIDSIAKERHFYSCWDDPMQKERDSWQ